MDLASFKASLQGAAPPDHLGPALRALWHQASGDWQTAHRLAQGQRDTTGAWVHAYLHRVEGDLSNAAYWYRRADKAPASTPLHEEWDGIVSALLEAADR